MKIELSYERYMATKAGILEWNDIVEIKRDFNQVYFVCPCGDDDHYAVRKYIPAGCGASLSPVLNCYEKVLQWMVKPIPIEAIIKSEEENYLQLLEKAIMLVPKIVHKRGYSSETLKFMKETHGIPEDVADDIWQDFKAKV